MKVLSVLGTRPNFVKEFLVHREFQKREINEVIVHTGQHYDYEMSRLFFETFDLPDPHYHFEIGARSSVASTAQTMLSLEDVLQREKPNAVLSYGDVNSTTAAAIAAVKSKIPFVHVEGGIRTPFLYNPEEINRRLSDCVADLIFTCTRTDTENLCRENVPRERICFSGDLMKDALQYTLETQSIPVKRGDYVVATIHREENADNPQRLREIMSGLIQSKRKIHFPVHPRTRTHLEEFGILEEVKSCDRIRMTEPTGYLEFIRLLAGADKVVTDSGGVRREAYLLRKPVIVPVELVWFPEILEAGWKIHVPPKASEVAAAVREFEPTGPHCPEIFGTGESERKIVDNIVEHYQ